MLSSGHLSQIIHAVSTGAAVTADQLDDAKAVIEARLVSQNITGYAVSVNYDTQNITVNIPQKDSDTGFDLASATDTLCAENRLTFRDPDGNVILDGSDVESALVSYLMYDSDAGNEPVVQINFNSEGTAKFAEATEKYIGQSISIRMDEEMISNPRVNAAITDGKAIISGLGTLEEATALADRINAGALPFRLRSVNED